MEDIIASVAWECGDNDCQYQWHQSDYWITPEGYTVDRYSDGDHEEIDESDLPTSEEVIESWQRYGRYVARTGIDPLGKYLVPRRRKVRERWQFRLRYSVMGIVLTQVRRAGRAYDPRTIPAHVAEFMTMKPAPSSLSPRVIDATEEDLEANGIKVGPWNTATLERHVPRDTEIVKRELRAAAKRDVCTPAGFVWRP